MLYNALYIGSKWCDSLPQHGLSNVSRDIITSLKASGQAKCHWFAFDEYYVKHKEFGDKALIKLCKEKKFDFIILDWMHGIVVEGDVEGGQTIISDNDCLFTRIWANHTKPHWFNPSFKTLDIIANKMKIPIIGKAWDTIDYPYIDMCERLKPYLKFHIISDSTYLLYTVKDPNHYLVLWPPRDPDLFYHPGENAKDIPISFIGRYTKLNTNREEMLDRLQTRIEIFCAGGQRYNTRLTPQQYASCFRRSKIALSFPQSITGISQVNGRMMEAIMSGALLMEDLNLETVKFFTPMVDYVAFYGSSDLHLKASYFIHHEDQRMEIAHNGYKKAMQYFNNDRFWEIVINKLKEKNAL